MDDPKPSSLCLFWYFSKCIELCLLSTARGPVERQDAQEEQAREVGEGPWLQDYMTLKGDLIEVIAGVYIYIYICHMVFGSRS